MTYAKQLRRRAGVFARALWREEGSISQRTIRSGIWVMGSQGLTRLLGLVKTLILVRLLVPADFGIMGIAFVAVGAMDVFTQTGMSAALVHQRATDRRTLDTAWIVSIGRGILLCGLLFVLAPLVARFYNTAALVPLLRVIAVAFLVHGFSNIGTIHFTQEIEFKTPVLWGSLTRLAEIVITVALAFWLRSVWALVLGYVAGRVLAAAVSYHIHPYRPTFAFDRQVAWELFRYGKHVFGYTIIIFFIIQGDNAFVGKFLGMEALGFYVLAFGLANLPATGITHIVSQVTFPAYSKLQDDLPRLRQAYLRVLSLTAMLTIPASLGLFILAPDIVRILYGERYLPMVGALQVLCFYGLLRSLTATTGPLFKAVGRPDIIGKVSLYQLLLLVVSIYPLTKYYNIMGTSFSTTMVVIFSSFYYAHLLLRLLDLRLTDILKPIIAFSAFSMIMVLAVAFLKSAMEPILFFHLMGLLLVGIVVYLFQLFAFQVVAIKLPHCTITFRDNFSPYNWKGIR